MFVLNSQVCKVELTPCLLGANRPVEQMFSVMNSVLSEKENQMRVDKY